jgi:hypothetical protein
MVEVDVFNITSGEAVMSEITTVGIDLAKNVLSVHGVDGHGKRDRLTNEGLAARSINRARADNAHNRPYTEPQSIRLLTITGLSSK